MGDDSWDGLFGGLATPQDPTVSEQLHFSLQCFYHALAISVTDPVVVPSGISLAPFTKMYFDCTDPPEEGRRVMRCRAARAGTLIDAFLNQHEAMNNHLASIEESANARQTLRVKDQTARFLRQYREHVALIAAFHQKPPIPEDLFLEYPTLNSDVPGFQRSGLTKRHIWQLRFNPQCNREGTLAEASALEALLDHIGPGEPVQFGELNTTGTPYSGSSWLDSSYRGRIEFTQKMLLRAKERA